jgi:hypothetical protein
MSNLIMTDAEADLVTEMAWADEFWAYEQELAWEEMASREEEYWAAYCDEDSDYSESLEFEPLHDEYPF